MFDKDVFLSKLNFYLARSFMKIPLEIWRIIIVNFKDKSCPIYMFYISVHWQLRNLKLNINQLKHTELLHKCWYFAVFSFISQINKYDYKASVHIFVINIHIERIDNKFWNFWYKIERFYILSNNTTNVYKTWSIYRWTCI